jgi:hypothetical protein
MLAVGKEWNVVTGTDVHISIAHFMPNLRSDSLGLADLLRVQPQPFQHVLKVHVSAEVQLMCTIGPHSMIVCR